MRYTYACFKNYIGFYNGMGLSTVEIDFRKCKSNIILIIGANGTGKSTLENALTVFPDQSSSFVPGKDAEKILTLYDNGDIYNIKIVYPVDGTGNRKTCKAFISKNGLELNANGNISSYKEIIFSYFDLDSNYSSLTNLSFLDRGIADKTPAERKKFASAIISNLEVYNNMYKTLNKKSIIFKSQKNNLHTKIQNIGSKEGIESTLLSLNQKNDIVSNNILNLNNKIVELQTINSINQEEAEKINQLKQQESELNELVTKSYSDMMLCKKNNKIDDNNIERLYLERSELLESYKSKIDHSKTQWLVSSEKLSSISNYINELKASIESQSLEIDIELETRYNNSQTMIDNLENKISKFQISLNDSCIYELNTLIELFGKIVKKIDVFYDGLSVDDLYYISMKYNSDKTNNLIIENQNVLLEIEEKNETIKDLKSNLDKLSILDNRPDKCNMDTCPFIEESVKISKNTSKDIILSTITSLEKSKEELSKKYTENSYLIEISKLCDSKHMELGIIRSDISEKYNLITKFHIDCLYNDKFDLLISNGNNFNEIRDSRKYIDLLNDLKSLQYELNTFHILKSQYDAMKDKLSLIEKNKIILTEKEKELNSASKEVSKYKFNLDKYNDSYNELSNILRKENEYMNYKNIYSEYKSKLDNIQSQIKVIEDKSSESIKASFVITDLRKQISQLQEEQKPIVLEIQRLSGQLTLLSSYYQEYELYKAKFDMIETLKKYCSPTKAGIQTLFMQLYMSKTLDLANQILGMLFGGEYRLLDFIINENEFRIPFVGSGLTVDDISSGSASQVAMMGLAINLALFKQSSSKFNIIRLDEVDGQLDTNNRLEFINVLYQVIRMLDIEQVITISHSIETDASLVDIIKLKKNDEDGVVGNIIWDYDIEIQKEIL